MSRSATSSALVLAGLLVLAVGSAQAAPGDLDPSFGSGGKATAGIGSRNDSANAVAIRPDGKIVGAGSSSTGVANSQDFALFRLNSDGSLDTGFGSGGTVTTAITAFADYISELALQPDGKIVAVGKSWNGSNYDFSLARYNADGSLDTGFGSGGIVISDLGSSHDEGFGGALQPDGKIVVVGGSRSGLTFDFALARYNPDGSLDTGFGSGGKVTTPMGSGDDAAQDVAIQPDGKVVAAGYAFNGTDNDFALARYNSDGSLDTGFGSGGKAITPIGSADDAAQDVAIHTDGKIVAVGSSDSGSNYDFALARYNSDGSLDTGFGSGGKMTTPIGSGDDAALAAELQPDGKIVAVGYSDNGTKYNFALARYNSDGTLDTGFGSGGKVTTGIGATFDFAYAAALQSDGRVVATGSSHNGANNDFAVARYLGSTLTVTKAGSGAGTVSSSPVGLDCGATCSAPFAAVPVTLTAAAAAGSSFTSWSGDCAGAGTCMLTMSADHAATATFESDKTLTVTKAGSGSGSVGSSPTGVDCGSSCSHAYTHGTSVTLTATAAAGSSFAGWSGDCTGTGTCTLTMSADHAATATFESDKTLTVSKAGAGSGTVSSSPAGISCGSTCSHAYAHGASVTLTAAASSRSKFAGWSGDCSGTGTCTLTMSTDRSASARFLPKCIVPKVKGKKLAAAKRAIRRAHCSVGKVRKAFSAKVRKGRVISQKPRPGKKLAPGAKVNLKVSKGPSARGH